MSTSRLVALRRDENVSGSLQSPKAKEAKEHRLGGRDLKKNALERHKAGSRSWRRPLRDEWNE